MLYKCTNEILSEIQFAGTMNDISKFLVLLYKNHTHGGIHESYQISTWIKSNHGFFFSLKRDGCSLSSTLQLQLPLYTLLLLLLEVQLWKQEFQQWTLTQSSSFTMYHRSCSVHTWPLKLVWLPTVTDTEFAVMITIVMIHLWQTSFGYFTPPRFGTSGILSSSSLERNGVNSHFCTYTIISPFFCSTGSTLTHNTMEMYTLQLFWTDSSTLSCTLITSSACTPRILRLESLCLFGGNHPWQWCNWFNSLPWWLKLFTWCSTPILVQETVSETLLLTLYTFWVFSSFSHNSLFLLTWSQRKRRVLKEI